LYVNDCYFKDDCLHHIANHTHIAISAIYEQFCGDCQRTTVLGSRPDTVYIFTVQLFLSFCQFSGVSLFKRVQIAPV